MSILNSVRVILSHWKVLILALLSNGQKRYHSHKLNIDFQLDLRYLIDFLIYRNDVFQEENIQAINNIFSQYPIDLFVDIGSHIGQMSLSVKQKFPETMVISIEPSKGARLRQKHNMQENDLDYTLEPYAIGEAQGKGYLYQPKKSYYKEYFKFNDGRFSLLKLSDSGAEKVEEIQIVALDQLLGKSHLDDSKRILIKIDVEGSELEVIRGGLTILKSHKVILMIELGIKIAPNKCGKLIQLLNQLNYQMYNLELQPINSLTASKNVDVIFMN